MALIPLNAKPDRTGPTLRDGQGYKALLCHALRNSPDTSPIVILLHGKGYAPNVEGLDPHELIFAPRTLAPGTRFVSWPRRLGFPRPAHRGSRGVCIAFGWRSTGSIWRATEASGHAAQSLGVLLRWLREVAPSRPVHFICHSLGARVGLRAVETAASGQIGRVVMLAGAAFTTDARRAARSPAGHGAEFFNITSRENDIFDWLFETALAPLGTHVALGRGIQDLPNWLDLQLDHPQTEHALREVGIRLAPTDKAICHWSLYLRPGAFKLYRHLLIAPDRLDLDDLRTRLSRTPQPRWSRLAPLLSRPVRAPSRSNLAPLPKVRSAMTDPNAPKIAHKTGQFRGGGGGKRHACRPPRNNG